MTMLMHTRGPFERTPDSSKARDRVRTGPAAGLAKIKRLCVCAITILAAAGALAGIIALKATVYLSRLNY
jgi:hypothetical protein